MEQRFYRIRVKGRLSERFAAAFDAMELQPEDGSTVLTGVCVDASALFGVLERIRDLGLELWGVESHAVSVDG
jgi:hypothetical protein